MKRIVLLVFFLILLNPLYAQYRGQQPLQKSFEQTSFFYQPNSITTWTIGEFNTGTPGLFNDPLNAISVNTSLLNEDYLKDNYLYIDFRSIHDKQNQYGGYPVYHHMAYQPGVGLWYPYRSQLTTPELDPLLSLAYLSKPFENIPLRMGLSYQAIYSNDSYYRIPHDIYTHSFEHTAVSTESGDLSVPVTDRYSGADDMSHFGNHLNFYTSYSLTDSWIIGTKIGFTGFGRSGNYGSSNLWDNNGLTDESFWSSFEDRNQNYRHFDFNLSSSLHLNETTQAGVNAGILLLNMGQDLNQSNESNHSRSSTSNSSFYDQSGLTTQRWDHKGQTYYYGLNLKQQLSETASIFTFYKGYWSPLDLDLSSDIESDSESEYSSSYNGGNYFSESYNILMDNRTGGGDQTGFGHQLASHFEFAFNENDHLYIGLNLEHRRLSYDTREDILAYDEQYRFRERTGNNEYLNESHVIRDEDKQLHWDYNSRRTRVDIPLIYTRKITETISLAGGVQRTITDIQNNETILEVFNRREITQNGQTEISEDFADRYRYPEEKLSDVSTSALFGFILQPNLPFKTEVFVSPGVRNSSYNDQNYYFRWWITFKLAN